MLATFVVYRFVNERGEDVFRAVLGKNRLPVRFFLPLGIVLVVLAVAVGGVYGFRNATLMLNNTHEVLGTSLSVSADLFDRLIEELNAMSYDIVSNRTLYPYAMRETGSAATQATEWLTSFKNANSYLKDIILFSGNASGVDIAGQDFITTYGVWTAPTFWRFLHPISYEGTSLSEWISNAKRPLLLFPVQERIKSGKSGYLVYAYPGPGTRATRSTVLFLVDAVLLEKNLGQTASAYSGALQVYASDGRLLYSAGTPWQQLTRAEVVSLTVGDTLSFPGESSLALYSVRHGFTYVLRVPSSALPSQVTGVLLPLLPILAALVALGLAAAFMILRSLLHPIAQITDILAPYEQRDTPGRALGNIVSSIRALESQKDRLEYCVERQAELSQMQCIHNLLHGEYQSDAEIHERFSDVSIASSADRYVVLVTSVDMDLARQDASTDIRASLVRVFTHVELLAGEERFSVPLDSAGMMALLVGVPALTDVDAHLHALFMAADAMLHAAFGASLTVGAGMPVSALSQVPLSFDQAWSALGNCFFTGTRCLLPYDPATLTRRNTGVWYPVAEEEALIAALSLADYRRVALLIGSLLDILRAQVPPVHIAKTVCSSVTHRLIRYAGENAYAEETLDAFSGALRLLERPNATLDAFEDALLTGCAALCGAAEGKGKAMRGELLCRRVMDYGREHFADQMLTLSTIAEAFSLSEGHLSRTFKEQTGHTVMQWLDTVRMTHAQGLLRETSLPLDDIIARCGYWDKGNFIRKFKKEYQLTPMQYREAAQTAKA